MKHLKTSNNNSSFDGDDHVSLQSSATTFSHHHSSTTSLNNICINSHDFELRKRDIDHQHKKHRFFHKRKSKDNYFKTSIQEPLNDDYHSSSTATPIRTKYSSQFFGQSLDELMKKNNNKLPPIIQVYFQLLEK
jgi:hypothetical protein